MSKNYKMLQKVSVAAHSAAQEEMARDERVRRRVQEVEWDLMEGEILDEFRDSEQVMLKASSMAAGAGFQASMYEQRGHPRHKGAMTARQAQGEMLFEIAVALVGYEAQEKALEQQLAREVREKTGKEITPTVGTNYYTVEQLVELATAGPQYFFKKYRIN